VIERSLQELSMSEATLHDVRWPAFWFGALNSPLYVHRSADELSELSPSSVRYMSEMSDSFLVDSSGARYDLSPPAFVTPPPAGVRGFIFRMRNRWSPVRWSCATSGIVPLSDLKTLIKEDWKKHELYWQAFDLAVLDEQLEKAETYEEVFAVFLSHQAGKLAQVE
jgi:hypothetical protein